jgi:electron transport complex protein RnfG
MSSYGYGGKIMTIMALNPEGKVLGVRILSHSETPGLGDKIEIEKDDWVLSFNGRSLGAPSSAQWGVKKDGGHFDQFSGATITPRAVVKAVKSGLELFAKNQEKLLIPVTKPITTKEDLKPEKTSQNEPLAKAVAKEGAVQ